MCAHDVKLSKMLSWLLRHGAVKEGLNFDDGGFIEVDKILQLKQFKSYTLSDIQKVVETNDKKRFTMRHKHCDSNVLQIRANQGHSLKIDENGLLTLLNEEQIPPSIYHGTYLCNLSSIRMKGLSRMQRNHIHFTPKFPEESGVISGIRKNCEICIVVDAKTAFKDGFRFFESDNKVILCPGDEHGWLPATYIKEIWQLNPLKKLN